MSSISFHQTQELISSSHIKATDVKSTGYETTKHTHTALHSLGQLEITMRIERLTQRGHEAEAKDIFLNVISCFPLAVSTSMTQKQIFWTAEALPNPVNGEDLNCICVIKIKISFQAKSVVLNHVQNKRLGKIMCFSRL